MSENNYKIYYCTANNSNASAYEKDDAFIVCAGSRLGEIVNNKDTLMLRFRRELEKDKVFKEDGLTLRKDQPFFLNAEEVARIVTGDKVDESAWVSPEGSHPFVQHPKMYHCTDYGSSAKAFEKNGFFMVCAGSTFGPDVYDEEDISITGPRKFLKEDNAFEEDGLTLRNDEPFVHADYAVRVVTGHPVDARSWIAEDGSHPLIAKSEPLT